MKGASSDLCLWFGLFFLYLAVVVSAYDYEKGPVEKSKVERWRCPGLYCGRSEFNKTHYSGCGKCDRGWRVANNTHSICRECTETPPMYDWLFLAFHVVLVLVLHWMAVDLTAQRHKLDKTVLTLHLCAAVEVATAAILTILATQPVGQLSLTACRVNRLADWYTFFQNPTPNYEKTLNCTQEAVYPLYTMVFIFYALCGVLMLLMRPLLASKMLPRRGRSSVYAALYFLPILAVVQAVGGGLVYGAYPYIVLILSLISSAYHFACKLDQSVKALFVDCVKDLRNAVILFGHWLLHAFGLLAITQIKDPGLHLPLLSLVPVPALFYIVTAKFSQPDNFISEMNT